MRERLDEFARDRVAELYERGKNLIEARAYEAAIRCFDEALDLLPEPKEQWEEATWLFAAIGDARFLGGDRSGALQSFLDAMKCPDAIASPFLHLRLGELEAD